MHIRDAIKNLHPYKPGRPLRDLEALGIQEGIKLASNENPVGPSPMVLEAMERALRNVRLYPEPGAPDLRETLAERFGVGPDQVIAGAGIDDLIDLTVRVLLDPGDDLVLAEPGFIRYAVAAGSANGVVKSIPGTPQDPYNHDLEGMLAAIGPRTRMVVLVNPNNPTGSHFGKADLESFLARVPEEVLTILDEAYFEFVDDPEYPDGIQYLSQGKPLLVFRTFSKCHSLAGLRVGYGIGPKHLVNHLDRARLPFNVNNVAQAAALAALEDTEHVQKTRALAKVETAFLARGLSERGWDVYPTQTNFVFCKAPVSGEPLTEGLLKRGIIVRPMTGFGMAPEFFRVSHGTRKQDEKFLEAVSEVTAELVT